MTDPVQQYPNEYGHPETELRAPHVKGALTLFPANCPIGMAITGPKSQVKVGTTLYDVLDLGPFPFINWTVRPGVDFTEDEDYPTGTPVWVPITHAAMEDIRARTYVTITDETDSNPNSRPLNDINLNQIGTRNHGDLMNVDANQHHQQLHRHDNINDGLDLYPNVLEIAQKLTLKGIAEIPIITADMNNFNPFAGIGFNIWLLSSNAARNITGISTGQGDGRYLILVNIGAFNITLVDSSASSAFANRFKISGAANKILTPDSGVAQAIFVGTSGSKQWRIW